MQMCILCCTNGFLECIFSFIFKCDYASVYMVVSVCLSVHRCVHLFIPFYFWKKKIVDFDDDKSLNDKINNATMSDDKVVTSSNPRGPCFHFFCMPLLLPELSYKNNLPRKHMRVSRAMEAKRGLSLLESAPRLLSYSLSTNRWCKKIGINLRPINRQFLHEHDTW